MKSLRIEDGDLVVGSGGYETIEGLPRVQQDIGLALQEPYQIDRFHPQWGSLLHTYIGLIINEDTPVLIEAEVRRVIGNYVAVQQQQLQADMSARRTSRFSGSEVVTNVRSIAVQPEDDRVEVGIDLQTLGRDSIQIDQVVS